MMAVEALLRPAPRSEPAQEHVRGLIDQTKKSGLSKTDRDSMIGSLRWLLNESISQTGRALVEKRLPEGKYGEMNGPIFFSYCYQLRSNLVHGNLPYPSIGDLGSTAAQLEVMVSDLVTSPFFDLTT